MRFITAHFNIFTFIFAVLQFFYNKSQHLIKYQHLSYFYNLRNYFFISSRYHLLLILILLLLYFYLFFSFETLLDKCCPILVYLWYLNVLILSICFLFLLFSVFNQLEEKIVSYTGHRTGHFKRCYKQVQINTEQTGHLNA